MNTEAAFSERELDDLKKAKILGVRSGDEHRFTGVWPVVVEGRLFVRSWNDKPTGWYRALLSRPNGSIQVGGHELVVYARPAESDEIRDAVTRAFAEKYNTKGSQKWVIGFAEPQRAINTLELVPAR
jgi:hypothetical protein